jgi:hypothetical protein
MIALALLIVINLFILKMTREPSVLVEVRQRYKKLRDHIIETKNEKYRMLTTPVPLTGMQRMKESVGLQHQQGCGNCRVSGRYSERCVPRVDPRIGSLYREGIFSFGISSGKTMLNFVTCV